MGLCLRALVLKPVAVHKRILKEYFIVSEGFYWHQHGARSNRFSQCTIF